jgi:hypothetical protein
MTVFSAGQYILELSTGKLYKVFAASNDATVITEHAEVDEIPAGLANTLIIKQLSPEHFQEYVQAAPEAAPEAPADPAVADPTVQ